MIEIAYSLQVYGWLWDGSKAVYSYTLSEPFGSSDNKSAELAAVDFQALIDWRLVKCTHEYEKNRRIDTYKTLRGFRNGMSPARFYHLVNMRG